MLTRLCTDGHLTVFYVNATPLIFFSRNFILRDVPQIQYKNPLVQIVTSRNTTEYPQIKLFFGKFKLYAIVMAEKVYCH